VVEEAGLARVAVRGQRWRAASSPRKGSWEGSVDVFSFHTTWTDSCREYVVGWMRSLGKLRGRLGECYTVQSRIGTVAQVR
jgi:hypothetical protein